MLMGALQPERTSPGPPLTRPTHAQLPEWVNASASGKPSMSGSCWTRSSEWVLTEPVSEPSAPTTGSRAQVISGSVASGVGNSWTPRNPPAGRASCARGSPTNASVGRASAVNVPVDGGPPDVGQGPDTNGDSAAVSPYSPSP